MADLIEDMDGAPLPEELQVNRLIYNAIRAAVHQHNDRCEYDSETAHDIARRAMIELAPILWPILPSNDDSAESRARDTVRFLDGRAHFNG